MPDVGLVDIANQGGYDAQQYRAGNLVLVTNNGSDFRKLHADQSLHGGLITIVPSAGQPLQETLFRFAPGELAATGEPVNRLIVVDLDDQEVTFDAYGRP